MHFSRRLAIVSLAVMMASTSLGLIPRTASAADPVESITLTPTSKSYKVDAGQTFEDTLTILNDGDTAYDFSVYTAPYAVESGSYNSNFTSTSPSADAYTWIQFKQTMWHAESRQTVKVPYTVHVKNDASPGGHYGVIFAEVQPSSADGGTLARKKRVGAIIYATVNGDVRLSGKIAATSLSWYQSSGSLHATVSVQNDGNSDFVADITYQVTDIFGKTKYSSQADYAVLPSTTRDIKLNWADAPWFGLYKARVTTSFLEKTYISESYVLIMPTWLLLLVCGIVFAGGIYAIWRWSGRKSR
jgi:hypothetical protein